MLERYNFSSDFQDLILASICRFPEKFVGIDTILESRFFTGVNAGTTAEMILEYYLKYSAFPTFTSLGQLASRRSKKSADGDIGHDLTEYIKKLSEVDCRDVDYAKEQVVKFSVERALLLAATEVARTVQEGKEPTYNIVEKFQSALSIGANLQNFGYDANLDAPEVINRLLHVDVGINSGFDLFDNNVWKHGMRAGWLIVPLAPPKSYKTTVCLNMARHIAGPNIGENVVYYACEIDEVLALQRYYQAIAEKTEEDLYENTADFCAALEAGLSTKLKANLFIKHFPSKSASINDIRAHLKTLIAVKGWSPRVVFIDYAETIKPTEKQKDSSEHRSNSSIYVEARALAQEFNVTVIMPDRCNRETVEQVVPTSTSFQGAIEKGGIVDVAFGLCGTPEELTEGIIRFFFFLNRHGPPFLHFRGRVDKELMTISVNEKLDWDALKALEDNQKHRREGRRNRNNNIRERINPEG
jgi:replicative DNA helicase